MRPRPLSPIERMLFELDKSHPQVLGGAMRFGGRIGRERIENAVGRLPERYPLVAASIEKRRGGLQYIPGRAPPIPVEFLSSAWHEAFIDRALLDYSGPNAPRMRAMFAYEGETTVFALAASHLIFGGTPTLLLPHTIASLIGDPEMEITETEPMIVDDWIEEAPECMLAKLPTAPPLPGVRWKRPLFRHRSKLGRVGLSFDRETTSAIITRARAEGVRMLAVLEAGFTLALSRTFDRQEAFEIEHSIDMLTLLHRGKESYFDIAGRYGGFSAGGYKAFHKRDPSEAFWDLARVSFKRMKEALGGGEPIAIARSGPPAVLRLSRVLGPRLAGLLVDGGMNFALSISNMGEVERFGVRHRYGEYPLLSYEVAAPPCSSGSMSVNACTFDGSLVVNCFYNEPFISSRQATTLVSQAERAIRDSLRL